jgi:hypothetical protein
MGCAVSATSLHAEAVKDGILEKSTRKSCGSAAASIPMACSPTMIDDRLPTSRPEITVNE